MIPRPSKMLLEILTNRVENKAECCVAGLWYSCQSTAGLSFLMILGHLAD